MTTIRKTIRPLLLLVMAAALAALAAACGGDPTPTPTAAPTATATPIPPPVDPIQQRLDDLYAKARDEGTVRIGGHPSDFRRDAWLAFEERYPGINVEYVALAGSEANSRLQSEWENDVWEWDILATGATYLLGSYATENHLLDIHDVIFHPEVLDDSEWLGGSFDANFLDAAGKYLFAYHVFIAETAFVRDDLAPVASFTTLARPAESGVQGQSLLG